jgi:hypothetical protein
MHSLGKQITFDEYNKATITLIKLQYLALAEICVENTFRRSTCITFSYLFFSYHKWGTYVKRDEKRFISSFMNVKAGFIEPAGVSEDSPER